MLTETLESIQQLLDEKIFMQDTHCNVIFGDEKLLMKFDDELHFNDGILDNPSAILFYPIRNFNHPDDDDYFQ